MTSSQTLDAIVAIDPKRSYSAEKAAWYHGDFNGQRPPPSYSVGVQPGFNKAVCQLFRAESFEKCLADIAAFRHMPEVTPNNE